MLSHVLSLFAKWYLFHRKMALARRQLDGYTISKVGSGTRVALTRTRISRPVTKPAEGTKGGLSLKGVLQRSHYPVRHATFQDRDGNALYLYAAL
jgi:hypothetical protein